MTVIGSENLLLEIGTEELPPRALPQLGEALGHALCKALRDAGLRYKSDAVDHQWFAAPRRLAVWVPNVCDWSPKSDPERRGPRVDVAFDENGKPTRAALGFAKSCGVGVDKLQTKTEKDGQYLWFQGNPFSGKPAVDLIPGCVERALRELPTPKRMRWGAGAEEFVRPVHWVVLMFGEQVIKGNILSAPCGNQTRGHRFHCDRSLTIKHADHYCELLEHEGRVLPEFAARRERIAAQLEDLARTNKAVVHPDAALLDEVTGLVEWPVALSGGFDEAFMALPEEVLVSSMQKHQRYFPLHDHKQRLLPRFIVVSNIESTEPGRVVRGNEQVLHARLADARFFWDSDRKTPLSEHAKQLEQVLFHEKLGTVADRTKRLGELGGALAEALGADAATVRNAAALAKADLVTDMVGEFPDLQGIMGRHYALHDGHPPEVAQAIEEHYLPRFAGDQLPRSRAAQVLALADRLDTLAGIFATGEKLRGDKDPYGLRRAALGVMRILIENELTLDLVPWLRRAARLYARNDEAALADTVLSFMLERLRAWYGERGARTEDFLAVYSLRPGDPLDFHRRMEAVAAFRELDAAAALAAANKRIANILDKAGEQGAAELSEDLYQEKAERTLGRAVQKLSQELRTDLDAHRYTPALKRLATLRKPVDDFFDQVMVMCEDQRLRHNRLALLRSVRELFNSIADISRLALR